MQRSPEAQVYQNWYGLKIWRHKPTGLRWQCLVKALFTCQQPGCGWQAKASETSLLEADHKIPHRGVWSLFADPDNLRCLCHTCHAAAKQSEERLGYSKEVGLDGWAVDPMHPANSGKPISPREGLGPMSHPAWFRPLPMPLFILCGPPASGKSTYAREHAHASDVILDLDTVAIDRFKLPVRSINAAQRLDCLRIRNDKIGDLLRVKDSSINAVWLIVSEPKAERRQWWASTMKPKQMIVLATPAHVCLERSHADAKRRGEHGIASIHEWWRDYAPRDGDLVIV